MKKFIQIISILMLVCLFNPAIGQKTYITRQGFLAFKALRNDTVTTYRLQNINVLLDYDKAEVEISFRLDDSLSNNIPTNRFLSDHDARISTRLSIPKIETQPHPDWNFSTKGELFYNELVYYMKGEGDLRHINGSDEGMACSLMLKLEFLDSDLIIEPFGEIKELHLYQSILSQKFLDERKKVGY